jgi:hypothetical protein
MGFLFNTALFGMATKGILPHSLDPNRVDESLQMDYTCMPRRNRVSGYNWLATHVSHAGEHPGQ